MSKTADGREFASLTEKDVDALDGKEFSKFRKWELAKRDERIKAQREEKAQIAAAHAAVKTLTSLTATYKTNGRLNDAEQAQAREALKNPLVPEGLRANLQKVFGL